MADPSKTEKATPKRREKARSEGSVLKVADLDSTILLWGNLFMFSALGASTLALLGRAMSYFLNKTGQVGYLTVDNLHSLAMDLVSILARVLLPFLAASPVLPTCSWPWATSCSSTASTCS